ncbi:MBL fold metallo-hydrolase [Erysipelothrix rhusiopathiae]|uniref:ComEC/Rec2 family competence protein n=2 Tax=Erysipelothrix rhusiopathiae TaxID=1648 RepID=UPI000210B77F|nr:MBL fold metallo-hydrolase [Erysipelothrix rhusiopathiae]AGN23711.1 putative competence protein ComEC [Erysipelothrix rhusiopathiae SY1027]AMS11513.1 competence protein ComEC [Erysipelothrix rhusiopathiae]AOO68012.1 competence protein ComEC [Erysipelothrix rhusiopathiae]AWU41141.1 competence protein ComEC [Erysipelothrix rhusiopathiae]MDE8283277.1 MBL fold metallo-hydrolase [Erysipelothrix rhusiopathiae]
MYLVYGMLLGTLVEAFYLKVLVCFAWTGFLFYRKHCFRYLFPFLFLIMIMLHQCIIPIGVVVSMDEGILCLNALNRKYRIPVKYKGSIGDVLWVSDEQLQSGHFTKFGTLPLMGTIYHAMSINPSIQSYFFSRNESYLSLISFQIRSLSEFVVIIKKRFGIPMKTKTIRVCVTLWYQYLFGVNASNLSILLRQVCSQRITMILLILLFPQPLKNPSFVIVYGPLLLRNLSRIFQNIPEWFLRSVLVFYSCKRLDVISMVLTKIVKPILGFVLFTMYVLILIGSPLGLYDWFFLIWMNVNAILQDRFTVYGLPPLVCLLFLFRANSHVKSVVRLVLIAFITVYNPCYTVTFINVGQGDSILIRTPFSFHTTLIDTGRPSAYFEVRRVLSNYGIRNIDQLIITHADQDHDGLRNRILEDYKVGTVIDKKGTPLKVVYEFLEDKAYASKNDNSIILGLKIKHYVFLFMGDASKAQERDLTRLYQFEDPIFLIKLGHHGSKTSTDPRFIHDLKPKFGLVSSDPSKYGHPHREVIDTLEKYEVEVLETSKLGTIDFVFTPFFDYFVSNRGHFGIIGMVIR